MVIDSSFETMKTAPEEGRGKLGIIHLVSIKYPFPSDAETASGWVWVYVTGKVSNAEEGSL